MLEIKIKDNQKNIAVTKRQIAGLAKHVLKLQGKKKVELSILLAGKRQIAQLNKRFRGIDSPTDVLAFSMHQANRPGLHPEILGDVVICPEIAKKNCKVFKNSFKKELYLYLIHGILHLLGYTDSNLKGYLIMKKEQQRMLTSFLDNGKAKFNS